MILPGGSSTTVTADTAKIGVRPEAAEVCASRISTISARGGGRAARNCEKLAVIQLDRRSLNNLRHFTLLLINRSTSFQKAGIVIGSESHGGVNLISSLNVT